jgi:putative ABC transport system substrate-binding protein
MQACARSRRQFLRAGVVLTSFGLLASCGVLPPQGQPSTKVPRIGHLARQDWPPPRRQGFKQGLIDYGYLEGENIIIEWRWAERTEQLEELASELVSLQVDLIVAGSTLAIQAAKRATSTIPIVMAASGDPVGTGLVTNLARPEGNVTGLSTQAVGVSAKRVELFKAAIPGMSRLGVLWDPVSLDKEKDLRETEHAAQVLGVQARPLEIRSVGDVERLRDVIVTERLDAITTLMDGYPIETINVAAEARIPSMCEGRGFPLAGGLMSYGSNPLIWYGRAAKYIDRIVKGAKPADLPVEQPTDFELVINMQTAQALGLTIPPSVLSQATELLQ